NNAVVFDFRPGVDGGAEMLGRRGEDHRFTEERPASSRRKAIEAGMEDRTESETRADVARRVDRQLSGEPGPLSGSAKRGPVSYEIGSAQDPDAVAVGRDLGRDPGGDLDGDLLDGNLDGGRGRGGLG
ncbi:MAG: hypothetical protein ACRCYU_21625, partial [Nocardioides sp.]